MNCPDPDTISAFLRGTAGNSGEIEAHIEGCPACRRIVAMHGSVDTVLDKPNPRNPPPRGSGSSLFSCVNA